MEHEAIRALIRTIPDFPRPGILFRDVTTLMSDGAGFAAAINALADRYSDHAIDQVAGIESRGFVFGAALAIVLGTGFVPVRKPGKLPGEKIGRDYQLEYGSDRLELHIDAVSHEQRILLVDDLIATGGTAEAAAHLIQQAGGRVIECAFIVDLPDLGGRRRLGQAGFSSFALCAFDGH